MNEPRRRGRPRKLDRFPIQPNTGGDLGEPSERELERERSVDQSAPQEPDIPELQIAEGSVRETADVLIGDHYPELSDAQIIYWFDGKDRRRGGRPLLGQTIKLDPDMRFALSGGEGVGLGADFLIKLNRRQWLAHTDQHWREACLDERLAYAGKETDDKGNESWIIKRPIPVFPDIVARHGAWNDDLEAVRNAIRQLPLFAMPEGQPYESPPFVDPEARKRGLEAPLENVGDGHDAEGDEDGAATGYQPGEGYRPDDENTE